MKKTPYRKPMKAGQGPTEHTEQVALMIWARSRSRTVPAWGNLFAIPNGGARHLLTAKRLKAEGTSAGVPDLFLAWPAGGRPGLFVEMKRAKGGRVSPEQTVWQDRLLAAGYAVSVCHGFDEARRTIDAYLAGTLDSACTKL